MPEYKEQHFVPQFYLKNFSDDGEKIGFINKDVKKPLIGPIREQCKKDYFYTDNTNIEKNISLLESKFSEVIKKILCLDKFELSDNDRYFLCMFITTQRTRTLASNRKMQELFDLVFKSAVKPMIEIDALNEGKKISLEKVTLSHPTPAGFAMAMSFYSEMLLMDLDMTLIVNRSNVPFISSDNPVVFINLAFDNLTKLGTRGLASEGLQIIFPISANKLLFLYDPVYYRVSKNSRNLTFLANVEEITQFNLLQAINAESNIYCNSWNNLNVDELVPKMACEKEEVYIDSTIESIGDMKLKEVLRFSDSRPPYALNPKFITVFLPHHNTPAIRSTELHALVKEFQSRMVTVKK